jgi:hypothetical protein
MAWISTQVGFGTSVPGGVNVCELATGSQIPVVLAHSLTIPRDALALAAHTLYWTQEGLPRSATLN